MEYDWFSPEVGQLLEKTLAPAINGYYWASHFVQVPINFSHKLGLIRARLFPRTPQKWLCTTNNYALVKTPDAKKLCESHMSASKWFESHPERVHRLERSLSIMNRTLASQTSLGFRKPSVSHEYLVRKYRKYQTLYEKPLRPDLAWSAEYMRMMAELMDELKLRSN